MRLLSQDLDWLPPGSLAFFIRGSSKKTEESLEWSGNKLDASLQTAERNLPSSMNSFASELEDIRNVPTMDCIASETLLFIFIIS